MRLHFEHMTVGESIAVIIAGIVYFVVSGYVWAVLKFLNYIF